MKFMAKANQKFKSAPDDKGNNVGTSEFMRKRFQKEKPAKRIRVDGH